MGRANLNTHSKGIFNRHRDVIVCLFLVISTFSVYWQIHNYDFVSFDDNDYVYANEHIQNGFSLETIKWAFTTFHASNWHPLTWLSHMLDAQIYGLNPGGHHITNLLFHIANALLLFFLFRKMTGHLWRSAFIASLFALHPLHVESVAWISERKDVLSSFFWILTMWSYIWYAQHPRIDKYLLVLLSFILGLMSKPMLVTLPFVLLLLDYYPLSRFHKSYGSKNSHQRSIVFRLILEKLPFFVLVVISCAMTFYAQKHGGTVASLDYVPIQARISNALVSYASYILKMLYPTKLAVLYPHPGSSLPWWQITGACFLLLGISFWAIRVIKQSPYFIVGWLWYLGTLVPAIGLVQVGNQSMADRYTYIPLIGIFFIISWGIPEFIQRWHHVKKILPIIAITILFILMAVTFTQVGYWKNSTTLFEHTIRLTKNNIKAHIHLGNALKQQGLINDAIKQYKEVLRIKPDYEEAHNNLGIALQEQGLIDDAIKHFEEALRIKPDFWETQYNLGVALKGKGLIDDAIKHYKEALRIKPDLEQAQYNLAVALNEKGLINDAIKHYQEALRIKPDYEKAHNNLGNALKEKGLINDAIKHFEEALRIKPDFWGAQYNLGVALKEKGLIDEAIKHFEAALRIKPDLEQAQYNLGIALFYKGDIDGSIEHFRKALQINPNYIDAKNKLNFLLSTQKQSQRVL